MNCNGLQLCGHRHVAKDVGRALLGRRTGKACGPVGQCTPAQSVHLLERPEEVWAAWRAPVLPYQEGAGGFERGVVKSLVSAETLNACALIGLHLWAAGSEEGPVLSCEPGMEPGPVVVNLLI